MGILFFRFSSYGGADKISRSGSSLKLWRSCGMNFHDQRLDEKRTVQVLLNSHEHEHKK